MITRGLSHSSCGACKDPYGYPGLQPGVAALLTPKQRSGDLPSRLFRFLSLNGTYDLTGR